MKRMSSYQKRKENIRYLEQACKELEEIAKDLAKYVPPSKINLFRRGIKGDSFLTPYNMGNFAEALRCIALEACRDNKE